MSRLPLVKIGIVGLGCDWLESLAPALEKMQTRFRVVGVYDDVSVTAQQWAERIRTQTVLGVRPLLTRNDLDAVLLGTIGWQGDWLLDLLQSSKLPVLLGPDVSLSQSQVDQWQQVCSEDGLIVIPEFRLRYIPSTLRLRELQATALGPVEQLWVHPQAWDRLWKRPISLFHLLDWCTSLVERRPVAIEPDAGDFSDGEGRNVRVAYEPRGPVDTTRPIEALLIWEPSTSDPPSNETLCELKCRNGTAVIASPNEFHWSSGTDSGQEKLTADRSSTEVVLDLFARRVLGGLIPTPDLGDLRNAHVLADVVRTVQQTGERIAL